MDTPKTTTTAAHEKRQHIRHTYERKLLLEFPGQPPMLGDTRDVSLGGAFVHTDPPPANMAVGQEGFLRLETKHNSFHIPCKVVYVTTEGLALNLLGQEAVFGLALAMDAFEQIDMPKEPMSTGLGHKKPRGAFTPNQSG